MMMQVDPLAFTIAVVVVAISTAVIKIVRKY
jgi:hypothetical protein